MHDHALVGDNTTTREAMTMCGHDFAHQYRTTYGHAFVGENTTTRGPVLVGEDMTTHGHVFACGRVFAD